MKRLFASISIMFLLKMNWIENRKGAKGGSVMHKLRRVYALLAILSFVYSVAVFMVGSGTFSFIIWIFAAIFWSFLYLMDKKSLWPKIPKAINMLLEA
jgi:hypothetical protein